MGKTCGASRVASKTLACGPWKRALSTRTTTTAPPAVSHHWQRRSAFSSLQIHSHHKFSSTRFASSSSATSLRAALLFPATASSRMLRHKLFSKVSPAAVKKSHYVTTTTAKHHHFKDKKLWWKGLSVGFVMGAFGGLVGQGGGVVAVPALTALAGLSQHQAHGTSLVAVVATGMGGALAYYRAGTNNVDVEAALCLAATAILFARWGALATKRLSGEALRSAMGVFMLVSSVGIAAKAFWFPESSSPRKCFSSTSSQTEQKEEERGRSVAGKLYVATIGCFTGFASGMLGIGGGLIMVPLLTLGTSMTQVQVLATSLLAMVPSSLIASYTHHRMGHVMLPILPPLLLGTCAGSYLGAAMAVSMKEWQQRATISFVLCVLGLRMLPLRRFWSRMN